MTQYTIYFFFLMAGISLAISCGEKDGMQLTPHGYSVKYHIDKEGESPAPGDEVFYRMYVRNGDSIVHRSYDNVQNSRLFSSLFLPDASIQKIQLKPHEDALSIMSPGDSLTIFYPIDTLDRKPIGFENEDFIFYDLVLLDIKKKEIPKVAKEAKPLPIEDYEVSPGGYPVVFHIDEEGTPAKIGDYIHFRMYIRNDKEVVFSTEKNRVGNEKYKVAQYIMPKTPSPQMDAFGMMSPGDSLTLFYQIDTMTRKPKGFENSDMVYYDLVMVDVLSSQEHNKIQAELASERAAEKQAIIDREPEISALLQKTLKQYKNNELGLKLRDGTDGLQYIMLEPGNGVAVETGNEVKHHFYCIMEDGMPFGGSYSKGDPYGVTIGTQKVVAGWEQGLRLFDEGSKGILFVPAALAYGEAGLEGKVPSNTDLIFYIDIEEVRK